MSSSICTDEIIVLEGVYEPREDTYLTCICVEYVYGSRLVRMLERSILRSVEVGSGTGIVSIKIVETCIKNSIKPYVISIDIDPKACENTLVNVKRKSIDNYVDVICCSSLTCIRRDYTIDIMVSNPPYLPEDENCRDLRVCAGPDGRAVIDELLREFLDRSIEIMILTQSSLSGYEKTVRALKLDPDVDVLLLGRFHVFFEDIITIVAVRHLQRERFKKTSR
ncbi:MAG: methyltransferase [Crenarchaeota archaeon]|nr:methyltransferase [Thermoproteota archaeon]